MLYEYFIEKLIGLQETEAEKIEEIDNSIHLFCHLKRKPHKCPCCGKLTDKVHDYREQVIKDIPLLGKFFYIYLRKRRYRCSCGKRFFENNSFLPKYHRMTNRLSAYVIDKLKDVVSFTSIAKEVNLSVSTVIRIFDVVSYYPKNLPEALSIDEFKGNTGGEKYQCILTEPVNKIVLDILPKRYEHYLTQYFNSFDKADREKYCILSAICGNHMKIFLPFGLKMLLKLLINIIGYGRLYGLLRLSENKNKRIFPNLTVNISRIQESCLLNDLNICPMNKK